MLDKRRDENSGGGGYSTDLLPNKTTYQICLGKLKAVDCIPDVDTLSSAEVRANVLTGAAALANALPDADKAVMAREIVLNPAEHLRTFKKTADITNKRFKCGYEQKPIDVLISSIHEFGRKINHVISGFKGCSFSLEFQVSDEVSELVQQVVEQGKLRDHEKIH